MMEGSRAELSSRVREAGPPIMQVMKSLKAPRDTIDLSQGVPFFGPPEDAVKDAMKDIRSLHGYGPDAGDEELREIILKKVRSRNMIRAGSLDNIMVTAGANMGFLNAVSAISDPGDEIILLDPFYFNHGMTLDILGVGHIHSRFAQDGEVDIDSVDEAINSRTRAIVMVSPGNPTGAVMKKGSMEALLELCLENGLWLISDETYEDFHYEGQHVSPASMGDELPVISLFSLSKSYGIPGWRQGYMVFPRWMFDQLLKVQDTTIICPSRVGQRLALYLIRDHPDHARNHMGALRENRKEVMDWLKRNEDLVEAPRPDGAFYAFPSFTGSAFERIRSMDIARNILEEARVLLVPGSPFGVNTPPALRISYGNAGKDRLREALERMDEWLEGSPLS